MNIKNVGVIGAGTMGNGIAQVFAQAGFAVQLVDIAPPVLDRGRQTIEKSLAKFVEKGKLSAAERQATLERLKTTSALEDLAQVDYVVEAIVEDLDAKRALFTSLDALLMERLAFRRDVKNSCLETLSIHRTLLYRRRLQEFTKDGRSAPPPRLLRLFQNL